MENGTERREAGKGMRRLLDAWLGYLITFFAVALLVGILLPIEPFIPLGRYPMAYIVLVMLCSYLFGEGPGILALVLGWLVFAGLFLPPEHLWPLATTPEGWAAQISFLLGTFIVLVAAGYVRRSRRRIQNLILKLEEEIEERKQAEEALQESQHDLTRAQAIAHIGSWRLDVRRNELLWSDETHRIFGIPKGTPLTYEAFLDTVHPDDREYVDKKWQAAIRGEPYDIEHRIRVGDMVKWIQETAELELDEQGQLLGGFGTARDITDRKLAELELAVSRQEIADNFALLQRALLPAKPPEYPGYTIASAYLPAPEAEIGGDFYDFFTTENGKIAILIGDVSGKGIPSASLAAATRSTVRAFAYDISSPDQALAHANAVLKRAKDDPSLFVTVFLVTLDSTGRTCYASAGHPPPAIYRAVTGEVRFLTEAGLLLGVVDQYNYEESECHLEIGDKLVLYTDGISEARRNFVLFGFDGIERVLREFGQRSPDEVVEALIRESTDWAGGRRTDDAAVIVVERRP